MRAGINRRQVLGALAGAGLLGSGSIAKASGAWKPSAPIKITVPWPPGGGTDLLTRSVVAGMADRGFPGLVENRPGASGAIGAEHVFRAAANGLTLLAVAADTLVIYPHLVKTRFDPLKLVPVRSLGVMPLYLIGRADLPANNVQELIALARKQSLTYASPGAGTGPHMAVVNFASNARMDKLLHVPFQGAGPLTQAVMTGQVDFSIVNGSLPVRYRNQIKILGGTGAQRLSILPDIPTFTEQGLPLVIQFDSGLFAPPETPADITAALAAVVGEIAETAAYKAKLNDLAVAPPMGGQAEFAKYIVEQHRHWGEVIRTANIRLE